jgi:hypothetical protein
MVQCPAGKLAGFFMRFTIRDLLWLTVVVGIVAAWWIHYRQYSFWDRQGVFLDLKLRAAGWRVIYSDDNMPELVPPGDSN